MIAIAVDDEVWAREDLADALRQSPDIDEMKVFDNGEDVLKWARTNPFDVAFLDIDMRGMDGLSLARELRSINRKCYIIFCTAYGEYRIDAFDIHANAYITKPILPEKLQREINYIKEWNRSDALLTVRCSGGFEAYDCHGNAVVFRRSKTKELLALLVSRGGLCLSSAEICDCLWGDDGVQGQKNMTYLRKLLSDLNQTLQSVGAEKILSKNSMGHYLDMSAIEVVEFDEPESRSFAKYRWGSSYN